jgi:hypothetical protein
LKGQGLKGLKDIGLKGQMHHLSIGRPAPEIQGEDIDGKPTSS